MTVVVNCRFLTRPVTGVERYAEGIVEALAAIRSDLVLVAPPGTPLRRAEIGGIAVRPIGSATGHAWEQFDLRRFLRREGNPALLSLANTGPARYRDQVVVIHDVLHRRFPQAHSRTFRWWYRVLTPSLIRRARIVATVSQFSKAEIADLYGRFDVIVVPNAVGVWIAGIERRPASLTADRFFLAVGSRSLHKGLATAEDAFRRYRAHGGTAQMAVVGSSHRSFAGGGLVVSNDVHELGRVADDELAWLYRHAQALLFPSLYEGFGLPPLEAQAAGTPVIASDIPALREVLSASSALWFPPTDAAALSAAMLTMDADATVPDRLIAAGYDNTARFTWARSASVLSTLLDRLALDPPVSPALQAE